MDMFRLNALVSDLMEPGGEFDQEAARELFESLPEETVSPVSVEFQRQGPGKGFSGLTNAGSFSFENKKETNFSIGTSKGTWIGKWRVTKTGRKVRIEPRFDDIEGVSDHWELRFRSNGKVSFLKSRHYTVRVGVMNFSLIRMREWKSERGE